VTGILSSYAWNHSNKRKRRRWVVSRETARQFLPEQQRGWLGRDDFARGLEPQTGPTCNTINGSNFELLSGRPMCSTGLAVRELHEYSDRIHTIVNDLSLPPSNGEPVFWAWTKIGSSRPSMNIQGGGARGPSGPGSRLRLDRPRFASVASRKSSPQCLSIRARTGTGPRHGQFKRGDIQVVSNAIPLPPRISAYPDISP
jgi:hypothetical protein